MKKTDFIWRLSIWYQETPHTGIHGTGPHTWRQCWVWFQIIWF